MVQIEEVKEDPMEQLLGDTLIAAGQKKTLDTTATLKGKDLVLLYFSVSDKHARELAGWMEPQRIRDCKTHSFFPDFI